MSHQIKWKPKGENLSKKLNTR